ncbi:MAG: aldolase/citrate lyase family protein [Candidatus Tectomicrobia bacterium]|nr:aldolase/citrate lyase family protein [Candidatus Tectomicrobia bacterium]
MRENRIKRQLQAGQTAVAVSGHHNADMVDFLGQFGFDGVWLEGEHGPVDWDAIGDLSRACDLWGMASVTRVNNNDPGTIMRALDRGTMGIVVPHVNTREAAEQAMKSAKFDPIGYRGMFGGRQSFGVPDYVQRANDQTLVVVLIEEIDAVNNLADILTVDNIDVFFVAPADLAQTMGHIGNHGHPDVQAVIDKALAQIVAAGRTAGTLATDDNVERYRDAGVRFFLTGWPNWVSQGAKGFLERVR